MSAAAEALRTITSSDEMKSDELPSTFVYNTVEHTLEMAQIVLRFVCDN